LGPSTLQRFLTLQRPETIVLWRGMFRLVA
jgi:hypothetical protein